MNVPRQVAKVFVLFSLAIVMCGCASIGAPVPPSLELPKPPTDLRAIRKGNKVYLSWSVPIKTTDRQNVRRPGPTRVCRSLSAMMSQCDVPVGNVSPTEPIPQPAHNGPHEKIQAEFIDSLPAELQEQNPTRMATYAVEPLNLDARSAGLSNQVHVALAPTLPPPSNVKGQVVPEGVVLTWDCEKLPIEPVGLRYVYRIHRRALDTGIDVKLSDETCASDRGTYQDRTTEWQKNYEYRIAVVTFAATNPQQPNEVAIEGDDAAPRQIFTNDTFPPAVPTGLQAVFSGSGRPPFIDLVWAPDTDSDLAGYNVYRREESGQATKVNIELVKSPAFRDANVSPGKVYYYSVSAVDLRGNESGRSDAANEAVPKD